MDGCGYSLESRVYSDHLQSFWKSAPCPSALSMLLAARFCDLASVFLAVTAHFLRQIFGNPQSNSQIKSLSSNFEGTYLPLQKSSADLQSDGNLKPFRPLLKPQMLLRGDDSVKPEGGKALIATYLVRS